MLNQLLNGVLSPSCSLSMYDGLTSSLMANWVLGEGVLHALKEKWEARGKCIAESGVRLNAQHHAYQELRVKYTRLEAELDTTREFIGRTGNKRPRETPMSAALVRTPPNQMPLLPDPDTTQEFESVESM